jgi:hypothetical protein
MARTLIGVSLTNQDKGCLKRRWHVESDHVLVRTASPNRASPGHCQTPMMTNVGYANRLGALDQTWQVWAELGRKMTEAQWSSPTRCPGWDVAALYAHHSGFPVALSAPPPPPARPAGLPITAVDAGG